MITKVLNIAGKSDTKRGPTKPRNETGEGKLSHSGVNPEVTYAFISMSNNCHLSRTVFSNHFGSRHPSLLTEQFCGIPGYNLGTSKYRRW